MAFYSHPHLKLFWKKIANTLPEEIYFSVEINSKRANINISIIYLKE